MRKVRIQSSLLKKFGEGMGVAREKLVRSTKKGTVNDVGRNGRARRGGEARCFKE